MGKNRKHKKNNERIKNSGLIQAEKNIYVCSNCGNAMKIERKQLVKNPICRNCMSGQSFGEEKAIEILKKYKIQYEKEKTFSGLKGRGDKKLRFDFYIKGENRYFLLEIDGEQHQNKSEWGGNTKIHDNIKNEFCKLNNIQLYRIKYKFGKLGLLEKDIMRILNIEFSEDRLKVENEIFESPKVMTNEDISKAISTLKKSLKKQVKHNNQTLNIKPTVPMSEMKVGLKVSVVIPKELAREKRINKKQKGTIIKTTEKAIMVSNKTEAFWLPKYCIKVFKEG